MDLTLKLNARFQPKHRFELEGCPAGNSGKSAGREVTGGGTAQNSNGEIAYCDINICLVEDTPGSPELAGLSVQCHRHPQRQRSARCRT